MLNCDGYLLIDVPGNEAVDILTKKATGRREKGGAGASALSSFIPSFQLYSVVFLYTNS
jgi:hypothetical protein